MEMGAKCQNSKISSKIEFARVIGFRYSMTAVLALICISYLQILSVGADSFRGPGIEDNFFVDVAIPHPSTSLNMTGADLRELQSVPIPGDGFAAGAASIFWLNGRKLEDYPYLCKCNPDDLAAFKGGAPLPSASQRTQSSGGTFGFIADSFNKAEETLVGKTPRGPICLGAYSAAIFSSGAPRCDAENSSSSRVIYSAPLIILLSVTLSIFSIL